MKTYKVVFNDEAKKNYLKLDKSIKLKLNKFLKKLENTENPRAFGKSLSSNLKGFYRYRVSNFRIIAEIKDNELIILVVEVDKRSIIYK